MTKQMDQEPTSRLRRRSFFEGIENDGIIAENMTTNDTDVAIATSMCNLPSDSENHPVSTSLLKQGNVTPSMSLYGGKILTEDQQELLCATSNSKTQMILQLLQTICSHVITWLHSILLAWTTRFPTIATRFEAWRQEILKLYTDVHDWIKWWRGDAFIPVKYWVYPTQYLTYASISFILVQLIIYWRFQKVLLDLRVHECVFNEKLLASADLVQSKAVFNTYVQPGTAASKFIKRRFEQQYSSGVQQPGQARLPWTCLAVMPMGSESDMTQAMELAFLWPRSQVIAAKAVSKIASRVHVVIGANTFDREMETQIASAGIFAALYPLSAMRPALFAARFPDLVLVPTEFALRQMLKFRQEQQENNRRGARANARNALGRTSSADLSASNLAASHFGVYLLKTTVPDIYDRHIHKKWDEFLHVVIVNDADKKDQFTEELLSAWVAHPTWPMLHVRFHRSLALCGSFQRILSSMLKDYEADENAAETVADSDKAVEDRLEGLNHKQGTKSFNRRLNVDLVCEEEANTPEEIVRLKNMIGIHLFPVPPELEKYEATVLESLAVGAITVTYDTPIMQEWVPDSSGLRVGTFDYEGPAASGFENADMLSEVDATAQDLSGGENGYGGRESADNNPIVMLPSVHVTLSEIEHAVEELLSLDRVSRVAAGRSARVHYLRMRTHYLSAVAALDAAVCEEDGDDLAATQSEIGQNRRRKVEVETLRPFLY